MNDVARQSGTHIIQQERTSSIVRAGESWELTETCLSILSDKSNLRPINPVSLRCNTVWEKIIERTSRSQTDHFRKSSFTSRCFILCQILQHCFPLNTLQPPDMYLSFQWIVRQEGMQVWIVLCDEQFFLARVGINLRIQSMCNRFHDTIDDEGMRVSYDLEEEERTMTYRSFPME